MWGFCQGLSIKDPDESPLELLTAILTLQQKRKGLWLSLNVEMCYDFQILISGVRLVCLSLLVLLLD